MQHIKACRSKAGFTLLSTLIVIILIVISLFPLLRALATNVLVSSETQSNIIALNLARGKLEEIRSLPFSAVTDEAKAPFADYPGYQSQVIVDLPTISLKNVTVMVYWQSAGGVEQVVSFETYVATF